MIVIMPKDTGPTGDSALFVIDLFLSYLFDLFISYLLTPSAS
jgi:hypothetical protein